MHVKICGLTRAEDIDVAVSLGATHLGCVVASDSRRSVSPEDARRLFSRAPSAVHRVLVVRALSRGQLESAVRVAGVSMVQLHGYGAETAHSLTAMGVTVLRAVPADRVSRLPSGRPEAPIILDTGHGGTGRRFDWRRLAPRAPEGAFIAGGLTPENLGELLPYRPWGLDVSSGVEEVPGIKSPARMRALFDVVRDRRRSGVTT